MESLSQEEIFDVLPELYRGFLPEFFTSSIPREVNASCLSCPMTVACDNADSIAGAFNPNTKCCTYQPSIPNYLVGAILSDKSPELAKGVARMRQRIKTRNGITPLAVHSPPKLKWLYEATQHGSVGKVPSLLCGYYDDGKCSIWKYRDAVCSTFFCKHVKGRDGRAFWMHVKTYLHLVEEKLSHFTVYQQSSDFYFAFQDSYLMKKDKLTRQEVESLPAAEDHYLELWEEFAGREEAFYIRCFELASNLKQEDLTGIIGFGGTVELDGLKAAYRNIYGPALPKRLRLSSELHSYPLGESATAVVGYSNFDPLMLPNEVIRYLREFSLEEDLAVTRARLSLENEVEFDDELLLKLVHHRVLTSY